LKEKRGERGKMMEEKGRGRREDRRKEEGV
jgi:hypothetical protein